MAEQVRLDANAVGVKLRGLLSDAQYQIAILSTQLDNITAENAELKNKLKENDSDSQG